MVSTSIAWQTGNGNITLIYQGQGDGTIIVESDVNTLGSARSQVIAIKTVGGAVTKNLTVNQAACPFPIGDVRNYAYTGTYQEVELPAGQYKLQCWGAQGGSNAAASAYGITAKAGGKGGYSEGVITLTSPTTLKIYVGGAGSSSAGGFNGGGSTSGSASYTSGGTQGVSRMGGGGGATDIRLSDGALLSRMIVAGGGSGGAMCYSKATSTTTSWEDVGNFTPNATWINAQGLRAYAGSSAYQDFKKGDTLRVTVYNVPNIHDINCGANGIISTSSTGTFTAAADGSESNSIAVRDNDTTDRLGEVYYKVEKQVTTSSTSESNSSQVGYAGGGTTGAGYSSTYQGKQNGAGSNGSFGQGANQSTTNYRYCSGAGGGGWYGGGMNYSDSDMNACKMSGGGSGFVNTAANAGNRPSGYTGLELDSGTTVAGNTSFEAPGGGTETGHSGNGYARITRLS